MTLGWPITTVFMLIIAASMAELCSAYPTSGAMYHWAADLGGPGIGWGVALLNIVGLIAAEAGINYSCAQFVLPFLGIAATPGHLFLMFAFIVLNQGVLNHFGVRLVSILNDLSVSVHILGVIGVVAAIFWLAPLQPIAFLGRGINSNGHSPYWWAFLLGLLQAHWTYTGFDASAHMAEETENPRVRAPWGIVLSVAVAGVTGYALIVALTLAIHGNAVLHAHDAAGNEIPAAIAILDRAGRALRQCAGRPGFHGDVVLRALLHRVGVARAVFAGAGQRPAGVVCSAAGESSTRHSGPCNLDHCRGLSAGHARDRRGSHRHLAKHGRVVRGICDPGGTCTARALARIGLAAGVGLVTGEIWCVAGRDRRVLHRGNRGDPDDAAESACRGNSARRGRNSGAGLFWGDPEELQGTGVAWSEIGGGFLAG